MSIFKIIENDDFEAFKIYVDQNKNSILEKDKQGWNVISLLVHYKMPEYIDFILPLLTKEQINDSQPLNPLFMALEHKDWELIESFIKKDNIDFNYVHRNNENIVHYLVHRNEEDLALKIIENKKIDNLFSIAEDDKQLTNLVIAKGFNKIFKNLVSQPEFSENFNTIIMFDSIKHNNFEAFEEMYPYYDLKKIDELFNHALHFENMKVLNSVIKDGDIIPGKAQVIKLIELTAQKYNNLEDQESANEILDFLFSVKTNFNSFSNTNGENIWILAIKNKNDYLFDKLINENSESLNFEDIQNHTPLFFAIENLNPSYVKKILERSGNPNHIDNMGNNSLIYTIGQPIWTQEDLNNKLTIVNELLQYRVDLFQKNRNGESALSLAIHKKEMNIVSSLIWKGAFLTHNPAKYMQSQDVLQLNAQGNFDFGQSIMNEKTIDNFIALKQLGFSLSQKNENNDSFAMFFIKEGYLSNFLAVFKLLSNEETNEIDSSGNSLIMNAIKKKIDDFSLNMLFYFNELDFEVRNNNGEDIYDLCANFGNFARMQALINKDPNLNKEKIRKALPLILKNGEVSKYWEKFLSIDPSLFNFKDNEKNNVLMISASHANFKNIDYLFTQGIKYPSKNTNNQKQTLMDILISLPESYEYEVAKTLGYIQKSIKKIS